MKKLILSIAVLAAASFTSCKKDRTCTCTDTVVSTTTLTFNGKSTTTTSTATNAGVITYTKARKGDAKSACLSYKTTSSDDPNSSTHIDSEETMECSVK